jgi:hypothetical protein
MNDKKEALRIIKNTKECSLPDEDKNILDWTTDELTAYIKNEIKGMSPTKKLKFAKEINDKIREEKEKRKNNSK